MLKEKDKKIILAFAENHMRTKTAARQLNLHYNTVAYRLEKIHQQTGLNPENFYDLHKLVEIANRTPCSSIEIEIRPDGVHKLSPHQFVEEQLLRNVTVQVLRCKVCGKVSVGWYRQDDTEEIEEK